MESFDPRLQDLIHKSKGMDWVFVNKFKEGDVLEVRTRNTLYTMKVISPEEGSVLVSAKGGTFLQEKLAYVRGTTLTGRGTMVKLYGITVGFRLVLSVEGIGELVLSSTQEVKVNNQRILPVLREEKD